MLFKKLKEINFKSSYISFGLLATLIAVIAVVFAFSSKSVTTESFSNKTDKKVTKVTKKSAASTISAVKVSSTASSTSTSTSSTSSSQPTLSSEVEAISENQEVVASTEQTQPVATETVATTQQNYTNTQVATTNTASNGVVLSNGNTAGRVGSSAAAQMAAATGVSQATWEQIIARESNGNPNAANASGASGLFQTMPGWGSTATVQDQINAAVKAYNAQGLSAWGY
ncbi:hypothetical protein HMPREF9318_00893 [Streptococcus urinalis FB127-CNA-2]|uniref:transglycosylase SLT domain-containing protein n=1 Tax=Streptococcus urinalis TaxID=149016 RepID=UPI0002991931|nr:transglycosylase SLT domain-containing protein [Streptococcus urinalis]EKS20939.1 hypothetical protein HMPREF9318_00893 [Streptococcus urinalis FB127-CNA-2]